MFELLTPGQTPTLRLYHPKRPSPEFALPSLTKGFENAYKDGSYIKLYKSHPEHKSIADLKLKERTALTINNPFATTAIKSIDKKYWE